MSNFKETHTISINDEDQIIKFSRKSGRSTCEHKHIEISVEENEVLCRDCDVRLNPIVWISKYLKHINAVNHRNNAMLAEYREIEKRLEKKSKFMCTSCHEVNTIDFRKLPSKAAITRGMAIVGQEFEGMVVEVEG